MRRFSSAAPGATIGILLVSGCALPTTPVLPPIGVRDDGGVISVVLPACPDDPVKTANVTVVTTTSVSPDSAWSGAGFSGDQSGSVALGSSDWSSTSGDYSHLPWFLVDVRTENHYYSAELQSPGTLDEAKLLPAGTFLVDGSRMTSGDYRKKVQKDFPC